MSTPSRSVTRLGWGLLVAGFVACVVLGFWGFTLYQEQAGQLDPVLSRVYLTIQLFVLQSGSLPGVLPWQLEVARVFAPVVAAYTAVLSLIVLFAEQVEQWKARRQSGHVVVVGLHDTGAALGRYLGESGRRVVGVHPEPASPEVAALRAMGGLVVVGDPTLPHILRQAGVAKAANLVVSVEDDETTVEVVNAARELPRPPGRPALECVALLSDPHLWTQQVVAELADIGTRPIRIHFVNELSAGLLSALSRHPQISAHRAHGAQHIVTGTGPVMANTILALVRLWGARGRAGAKLSLLLLGAHEDQAHHLVKRYPEIGRWAALQVVGSVAEGLDATVAHVAYVCDEEAAAAAAQVLALAPCLGARDHLVVVRRRRSSVTDLVARGAGRAGGPTVLTLGVFEEVARSGILLTGTTELLARAMHEMYVEDRLAEGVAAGDPAMRPWDELPETLRHSNRAQAGHVATKLAALGRGIAPLTDWDGTQPLDGDEVEQLAELEHERWVAEREQQGWTPGPRNPEQRTTPYLVPWTELSEDVKDLDRLFARALPQVLAVAGLQLLPANPKSM